MLVYEKKVDNTRALYGNYSGNIPTDSDPALTYFNNEGTELTITSGDTYLDDGHGGIIRKSDSSEVNVFIGENQIIPPPVPVVLELESIEVTTHPTKISYESSAEKYDFTGMVVTATYSDGSSAAVTGYTTDPAEGETPHAGANVITVTYEDKSTEFTVMGWSL